MPDFSANPPKPLELWKTSGRTQRIPQRILGPGISQAPVTLGKITARLPADPPARPSVGVFPPTTDS